MEFHILAFELNAQQVVQWDLETILPSMANLLLLNHGEKPIQR